MKILAFVPSSSFAGNVVRDVLYGCWCKGARIGGGTVPPLNLLTIATILKQDGNEVCFLDALNQRIDSASLKEIASQCGAVVVLTSSMSIKEDMDLLSLLKHGNGGIRTIICGSHPTFMPESCLKDKSVDIAVRKEPDFSIRDIIRAFKKNDGSWKNVNGIAYKENNEVKINPDYPLVEDLNQIPIADRSLLPGGIKYFNPLIRQYPYTTSVTSRGCPGSCSFCTIPYFYGGRIRAWGVERVIEEIKYLLGAGYKEIYYRDETFTFSKNRTKEICETIISQRLKFGWLCNVRVGSVDRDTLRLMKKAGCHLIKIGVESGVQEILDNSKKGIKLEQTLELFEWAGEIGITTHAHLMFGMPGENTDSISHTIKFLKKISPGTMDIGICTPYPGSELFERISKQRPQLKSEFELDFGNLHTRGSLNKYYADISTQELESGLSAAYKSFYLRPSYMIKVLLKVRSISSLLGLFSAGRRVITFSLFGESANGSSAG